jgi:hypothetical protein
MPIAKIKNPVNNMGVLRITLDLVVGISKLKTSTSNCKNYLISVEFYLIIFFDIS